LNKVGHALHTDHPVFEKYTFDNRIRELCWQLGMLKCFKNIKNSHNKFISGFQTPAIPQSMYIFKNPGVGGEVISHQDGTYLFTEPASTIGFWIALDDATHENGW
jgi:phytanoyl-CoA hydroxylase